MTTTPSNPPFILDANVFIQAHRFYYAFDICPGFWKAIIKNFQNGEYFSLDKVKDELKGKDALWNWIKSQLPSDFFKSTSDAFVQQSFGKLMQWAQTQTQFTDAARTEFASVADAWIVAYGMSKGGTVVTQETLKVEAKARIPIPNACVAYGVPFCGTYEMLRCTNIQFELA